MAVDMQYMRRLVFIGIIFGSSYAQILDREQKGNIRNREKAKEDVREPVIPILSNASANRPLRPAYNLQREAGFNPAQNLKAPIDLPPVQLSRAEKVIESLGRIERGRQGPLDGVRLPPVNLGLARALGEIENLTDRYFGAESGTDEALKHLLYYAEEELAYRKMEDESFDESSDDGEASNDPSRLWRFPILSRPKNRRAPPAATTEEDATAECVETVRMRARDGEEINAEVPCYYLETYGIAAGGRPNVSRMLNRDDLIQSIIERALKLSPNILFKRKRIARIHELTDDELALLNDSSDAELEVLTQATDEQIDSLLQAVREARAEKPPFAFGYNDLPESEDLSDWMGDIPVDVTREELEEMVDAEVVEARVKCESTFDANTCAKLLAKARSRLSSRVQRVRSRVCDATHNVLEALPCKGDSLNFHSVKERIVGRAVKMAGKVKAKVRNFGTRERVHARRFGGATPFKACKSGRILNRGLCRPIIPASMMCVASRTVRLLDTCTPTVLSKICRTGFELRGKNCIRDFSPIVKCPALTKLMRGRCVPVSNRGQSGSCAGHLFSHDGHCIHKPHGRMLLPRLSRDTCPAGFVPVKDLSVQIKIDNPERTCGRLVDADMSCPTDYTLEPLKKRNEYGYECVARRRFGRNEMCGDGYKYDEDKNICFKRKYTPMSKLCEGGIFDGHHCHKVANLPAKCPKGYNEVRDPSGKLEECIKPRKLGESSDERVAPVFPECNGADQVLAGGVCFEVRDVSPLCEGDIDPEHNVCHYTVMNSPRHLKRCSGDECGRRVEPTYTCPKGTIQLNEHPALCGEFHPMKGLGLRNLSAASEDLAFCPEGSTVRVVDDDAEEDSVLCSFSYPASMPAGCDKKKVCSDGTTKAFCPPGTEADEAGYCLFTHSAVDDGI